MGQNLIILISDHSKNMKIPWNFYGFCKIPWKSIKIPCNKTKKNFAAYAAINKVL
jgi:hypothetical protein